MTEQLSRVAVENGSLLRALRDGGATSPTDLAERADILPNHVHRKLDALEGEGWIVRAPDAPKHEATLTDAAHRALAAIEAFTGGPIHLGDGTTMIPHDLIDPWPDQPRTKVDPEFVEDLSVSVGDKGVLQALTVRPWQTGRYQVVIGENRRQAANRAVEKGFQATGFLVPAKVRELDDDEAFEIALTENVQRDDLHWMDEAKAMLRLANRGKSGPQIERIFGKRGKRSIQDYTKIARELPADVLAQAYLPAKLPNNEKNPQCLTYTKAREMVGEKKERPALDLSPKLQIALLEVIHAARGDAVLTPGHATITRMAKPFVGGPLGTLAERKLIVADFVQRELVIKTQLSDEVMKWLGQVGYLQSPDNALRTVRGALFGDMHAAALARDLEYATPELNFPKSQSQLAAAPARHEPASAADAEADITAFWKRAEAETPTENAAAPARHEPPTDGEAPSQGSAETPSAPVTLAPETKPVDLPHMLAIVVLETALKIFHEGYERGEGTWGAPVLSSYYKDARGAQLVQQHKMLAFLSHGEKTLVCLTKTGKEWVAASRASCGIGGDGRLCVPGLDPEDLRAEFGMSPAGDGPYATYWLNPPAKEAPQTQAPEDASREAEVAARETDPGSAQPPRRDPFSQSIVDLHHQTQANSALRAAARDTLTFLSNIKTRSKAPKAEEIDGVMRRLEQALDAADSLNDGAMA